MESYRLAALKYTIFSTIGRNTKTLPRSKVFLWTVFKHGLLEGSTILLQYSAITRTPLEISRLGESKYAISPGYEVRPKNKSIRKCKKMTLHCECTWSHCIVGIRSGQDWASQNRCEVLFFLNRETHALQIWPTPKTCMQFPNRTSLETLRPSEVVESGLRHASVGVSCELVWSATFFRLSSTSHMLLKSSWLAEFKYAISPGYNVRKEKLWLLIIPARRPSEHTGLGPPQKGVNCNFSWPEFDKLYGVRKLAISDA